MCQEERRGGSTNTSRRGISLGSEQEGDSPVAASASAPEPRHPDTEYFSVVMLNSSLLKAMHVVDSFQNSILADYPELSSQVSQKSLGQFRL